MIGVYTALTYTGFVSQSGWYLIEQSGRKWLSGRHTPARRQCATIYGMTGGEGLLTQWTMETISHASNPVIEHTHGDTVATTGQVSTLSVVLWAQFNNRFNECLRVLWISKLMDTVT